MKRQVTAKEVLDLISINEMARIETFKYENQIVDMRVYPEPQKNPSFHLIWGQNYEVVLEIRTLKILEWKKKPKNYKGNYLPYSFLKAIINFLRKPHKELKTITNWEFLCLTWKENNPTLKKQLELEMPDYNNILKNLKQGGINENRVIWYM